MRRPKVAKTVAGVFEARKKLSRDMQVRGRNEIALDLIDWKSYNLTPPLRNYRFNPPRRWKIDCAWPDIGLALEIEGGVWIYGRHVNPSGFLRDMEKYNTVTERGYALLRYPSVREINFKQLAKVYHNLEEKKKC